MVVLEAIGLAASDIFNYNREAFKWDQELRFKKNETRLGMQIERFDLFREDIEDLVNLTVGKMDMYHGVGEIFLAFSLTLYTEGRLLNTSPTFYTSVYFFSIACAWIYILLSVWLAVYASISAHSFGVRLKTRYVRLPIPSLAAINRLTAQLSDFEKQRMQDMMRVPFSSNDGPAWQYRDNRDTAKASNSPWSVQRKPKDNSAEADLLGPGMSAFAHDDVLDGAATHIDKHVALYRRLQAKWQCFDAYSRVSMALGVNNLLQAVNFFVIGITLVNSKAPSTGYSLTVIFQACRLAIGYLDIAGMHKRVVTIVQIVGTVPVVIILVGLSFHDGNYVSQRTGVAAALAFFIMAIWMELLLWIARPSDDEASLPRNYRTVLFLDVFGGESYDPTETEFHQHGPEDVAERAARERVFATAERALATGQAALRRWEAIPKKRLSDAKARELAGMRREYTIWRKAYLGHLVQHKSQLKIRANDTLRDSHELRPWEKLTTEEQEDDEFAQSWVGPLGPDSEGGQYYSPELGRESDDPQHVTRVLTLEEVAAHVTAASDMVQEVLNDDGANKLVRTKSDSTVVPKAKVVRLPWKCLAFMTRVMQLMWLFLAIMQAWEAWAGGDKELGHAECLPWEQPCAERRRLAAGGLELAEELPGVAVPVRWPHGAFFRPTGLVAGEGGESLLWSSQYLLHRTRLEGKEPLALEPLRRLKRPGAMPLCAARPGGPASFLALLGEDGLALWREGHEDSEEVLLPLEGSSWRLLAGAVLPCADVPSLVEGDAEWCLVFAGWDGERLPLAALPLPGGALPQRPGALAPRLDVPLPSGEEVAALHLEAQSSRLWIASKGGELQSWDLSALQRLGRWRLRWPRRRGRDQEQREVAALGAAGSSLWLAAVSAEGFPELLRAELPAAVLQQ